MSIFSTNLRKITTAIKRRVLLNLTYEGVVLTVLSTFQVGHLRYKKISAVENSIASMTSEALLAELRKNDQPRKGKKARPGQY